jgi:hypothetical protein
MGGATSHDASGDGGCSGDHTSGPIRILVDYGPGDGTRGVAQGGHSMTHVGRQCWDGQVGWDGHHRGPVSWGVLKGGQCQDVNRFRGDPLAVSKGDRRVVRVESKGDRRVVRVESKGGHRVVRV